MLERLYLIALGHCKFLTFNSGPVVCVVYWSNNKRNFDKCAKYYDCCIW